MHIYCVYLTTYSGNKLPPFYIGSSSVERVNKGYRGSVLSRQYKHIWRDEIKACAHLFKTKIIKTYSTREEAITAEKRLQKALKVAESPMYINKGYAGGAFGISLFGKDHPHYGKPRSIATRRKISQNHKNMQGKNNTNAKTIIIITPNGNIIKCVGNFKLTCQTLKLPYSTMNRIMKQRIWPSTGPCVGFDAYIQP
jgi:hypothetical protein